MSGSDRRQGLLVAGLALALVALLVALGWWAWSVTTSSLFQRVDVGGLSDSDDEPQPGEASPPEPGDPEEPLEPVTNVLIAGSDSRAGLDREQRVELSVGDAEGSRADTLMLVQLRADEPDAALLSVPRDLRVTLCDGSVGRINEALEVDYGAAPESCLVETIADVSGIDVHHYVGIDMAGFVDLVDTVGGVEMCFEHRKVDERAGLDVHPGCKQLGGADALAYARARELDETGDFGRMERQHRLVRALLDEVAGAGFLTDVPRMLRTLGDVSEAVTTDAGFDLATMRGLVTAFADTEADDAPGATVPGRIDVIDGASYVEMVEHEAEELFAAFREGRAYEFLREESADER